MPTAATLNLQAVRVGRSGSLAGMLTSASTPKLQCLVQPGGVLRSCAAWQEGDTGPCGGGVGWVGPSAWCPISAARDQTHSSILQFLSSTRPSPAPWGMLGLLGEGRNEPLTRGTGDGDASRLPYWGSAGAQSAFLSRLVPAHIRTGIRCPGRPAPSSGVSHG